MKKDAYNEKEWEIVTSDEQLKDVLQDEDLRETYKKAMKEAIDEVNKEYDEFIKTEEGQRILSGEDEDDEDDDSWMILG